MGLKSCCPYCGGVIGQDCFNVEECGEITRNQAEAASGMERELSKANDRIATLERELTEARRDGALIDAMADMRVFDGIGGLDIDDLTLNAIHASGIDDPSEEAWNIEWRKQFRVAVYKCVRAAMKGPADAK